MLSGFPIYHYFHCGNSYSSEENGMRYIIEPTKKEIPDGENGTRKTEILLVTIWPGPWSREHTFKEKYQQAEFPGSQEGLEEATHWIGQRYHAEPERWNHIPSILDCEPDC